MNIVQRLRVVVASPGDVKAERDVLGPVIDEMNSGLARDRGMDLKLARWETDAYPGFHAEGPQGLIDPILNVAECDVLIGVFWKRFGTPTKGAGSGTEHEFLTAYEAWKKNGAPQIMVYFNQTPFLPDLDEIEQFKQVREFQKRFPTEGFWSPYTGVDEFKDLVRRHLSNFLQDKFPLGQTVQPPSAPPAATSQPLYPALLASLRSAYLHWMIEEVRAIPLSGIDRKRVHEQSRHDMDLAAVYTGLMTDRRGANTEPGLRQDAPPLSALEMLNGERLLALLGDPGSGKSTFVNFVALCLAGAGLSRADANLDTLRAPLPSASNDDKETPPPQPWDHGVLLPIRVVLREFVAGQLVDLPPHKKCTGDTLWHYIVASLPETNRAYAGPLRDELLQQGGLLLLDGLDEVPEADQRRVQVKAAVEGLVAQFPKLRVLATSRTYAYQRQDWKLHGFSEGVLSPFGETQIQHFIDRWYVHVGQTRVLRTEEAHGQAELLKRAIGRSANLRELAERPLLLTLMASLHAWRGGTLPEQREELYADAIELLLDQWESQKLKRHSDGTYKLIAPSLAEYLQVKDKSLVRQTLNRLAFEVHRCQPILTSTADISQTSLVTALMELSRDPDAKPARLIEYLSNRAGLLEPRGVGVYAFPHRTFQEYLAACHLTDHGFPEELASLLFEEPNRWREVVRLAGAKAARGTASAAWTLGEELCSTEPPLDQLADERPYWGALLAAEVLIENKAHMQVAARNQSKLERLRRWLLRTLEQGALPPIDRAAAGDALGVIGDPRFRADTWSLPDGPWLGFVEVPAGPFAMGSDVGDSERPAHQLTLPSFFIARYPVTVAQFRAFVDDADFTPEHTACLNGNGNHPVVNVTWYEAMTYCAWFTEKLQGWSGLPGPLSDYKRVTLPSEAEWEKAARGIDGYLYPWGAEPDPSRANYADTGIGRTSAVGAFPAGRSPFECLDMAGNVWEWTRSLWGTDIIRPQFRYPYDAADGREDQEATPDVLRVLRGGAFLLNQRYVRCAFRFRYYPNNRLDDIGFRVVLLP